MTTPTQTQRLLKQVSQAESNLRRATQLRDQAIWSAKDQGASHAEIAKASGMTRSGVQSAMRRRERS